ncbi:MAG: hypothetical protein NZ889_00360 [Candidatus Pacearchaeota archaeon]|nr:hypothetical protein [Candidatus Pacearchaeota archaeon]
MLKKKIFNIRLEILDIEVPVFGSSFGGVEGKTIIYDLTKILKGKNCEGKFRIKKETDSLVGVMESFMIYPHFIRKMIGKGVSIVEDSFVVKCQDSFLRIKPFLITRKKVHRSVRKALREKAKELITRTFSKATRQKAFQEVLSSHLQKILAKKLKKIYPLSVCEIRMMKVEK